MERKDGRQNEVELRKERKPKRKIENGVEMKRNETNESKEREKKRNK